MDNLSDWKKLQTPPEWALKEITGGRLKGMTDIKPMWRIQAMTEVYGPCGKGWTYSIDKMWTEPGSDGQVFAFALVNLKIGDRESIPGVGGSMLVSRESVWKNGKKVMGLYSNDEAYKMAVTDALGVAMKSIGVAADIYNGGDRTKYDSAVGPKNDSAVGPKDDSDIGPKDDSATSETQKPKFNPADRLSRFNKWFYGKLGEDGGIPADKYDAARLMFLAESLDKKAIVHDALTEAEWAKVNQKCMDKNVISDFAKHFKEIM